MISSKSYTRMNGRFTKVHLQHLHPKGLIHYYKDAILPVFWIDTLHKAHNGNAAVPYPAMHHFLIEMCRHVHISVAKWCIVGHLMHYGICDMELFPLKWWEPLYLKWQFLYWNGLILIFKAFSEEVALFLMEQFKISAGIHIYMQTYICQCSSGPNLLS